MVRITRSLLLKHIVNGFLDVFRRCFRRDAAGQRQRLDDADLQPRGALPVYAARRGGELQNQRIRVLLGEHGRADDPRGHRVENDVEPARDLSVRERLGAERARKHQVALLPRRDENVRAHRVQEQRQVLADAAEDRDEARSAVDRARVLADRRGDRALRRRDRVADRKLLAPVIILRLALLPDSGRRRELLDHPAVDRAVAKLRGKIVVQPDWLRGKRREQRLAVPRCGQRQQNHGASFHEVRQRRFGDAADRPRIFKTVCADGVTVGGNGRGEIPHPLVAADHAEAVDHGHKGSRLSKTFPSIHCMAFRRFCAARKYFFGLFFICLFIFSCFGIIIVQIIRSCNDRFPF